MNISVLHRLENGDRLSRQEFERLCELQQVQNAELINGVVRMNAAAVRFRQHGEPHSMIIGWLIAYAAGKAGIKVADNTSVRFDEQNEPQPDALMFRASEQGGDCGCRVADDGYLEGTPDLIVEIAASSVSIDAHEKRALYERQGVAEYILWRTEDRAIDWLCLEQDRYVPLDSDSDGIVRSRVFPGLCLDVPAILEGNMKKVLQT